MTRNLLISNKNTIIVVAVLAIALIGGAVVGVYAQELQTHERPVEAFLVPDYGIGRWRVNDADGEALIIMWLFDDVYYLPNDVTMPDGRVLPAEAYVLEGYVFHHSEWTAIAVGNGIDNHGSYVWLAPGGVDLFAGAGR